MTEEPRWWRWLAVLGLAVGVAMRAWPWLAEPLLLFEDGTIFFGPNYPQFAWGNVAKPYAGYVPYGANVAAVVLCRLPTEWIPTAFVATAACMQLAAGSVVLRRPWAAVAPFWVRVLLAGIISLLPLGSYLEYTTLAYMQWPMLAWLFLLLVEPADASAARSGMGTGTIRLWSRAALVAMLTVAHPLAAVLAPLALLRAVRMAQRARWIGYGTALAGYWLVSWLLIGDLGTPASTPSLVRVLDVVPALLVRVGLESIVGLEGWRWLQGCSLVLTYCLAAVCWLVAALLVRLAARKWQPATRTCAVACAWLLLAPLAASLTARELAWHDQWIVRYLWLARVAFLFVLLLAVTVLLPRWLGIAMSLGLACVLTASNARLHRHRTGADEVEQFLERLRAQEQRDGHRRLMHEQFFRDNQPPVLIRPH